MPKAESHPARRSSGISKTAAETLSRGKKAAQSSVARFKEREREIQGKAAGTGGAFFASRWWASRKAEEEKTGKKAAFELGPVELDGTKLGIVGVAIGAMGWAGDDLYNEAIYGTGLGVLAADQAINRYNEKLQETAEE